MAAYVHAVKDGSFPNPEREGYAIDPTEWESFLHTQSAQNQQPLDGGTDANSHRESDGAETAQPAEFRTSALSCPNEMDEKTGKKGELRTL